MSFTILCAADIRQEKMNLELSFASVPSMMELFQQIEQVFSTEGGMKFSIDRLQVFDSNYSTWSDLTSATQLREYSQLYAFQRDVTNAEMQKPIPPARKPSTASFTVGYSAAPYQTYHTAAPVLTHYEIVKPATTITRSFVAGPVVPETMPVSVRAVPQTAFPADPTDEVKVRLVFEQLDMNKNGVIEKEEWQKMFKNLRVPLSAATAEDLFSRADADHDTVANRPDFSNFAEHYPVLVDSLYVRIQSNAEETRRLKIVDEHRQLIDELQRRERSATAHHKVAFEELRAAELQMRAHDQDAQIKSAEIEDKRAELLQVGEDMTEAQRERTRRERTVQGARERERQASLIVDAARNDVEDQKSRIKAQEDAVEMSRERVRELEALLAEAKRDVDRGLMELGAHNDGLEELRIREKEAHMQHEQMQRAVEPVMVLLREAESEVQRLGERETQVEGLIETLEQQLARVQSKMGSAEQDLLPLREREAHTKGVHQQAQAELDEARSGLRQLEQDVEDFRDHRSGVEDKEGRLLEEEVRLREQRYNLEEREGTHHAEKYRHFAETGRLQNTPSY